MMMMMKGGGGGVVLIGSYELKNVPKMSFELQLLM